MIVLRPSDDPGSRCGPSERYEANARQSCARITCRSGEVGGSGSPLHG
jgi:hypothetical protein